MAFAQHALIETLEDRRLLASSPLPPPINVIGPTDGVTAAAAPRATGLEIESGTTATYRDAAINLDIELGSGGGVKETSLRKSQFRIINDATNVAVATGNVMTSGGGDTIQVKPTNLLAANTTYRVEFNLSADPKITDVSGTAFESGTFFFKTGTFYNKGDPDINFTKTTVFSGSSNSSFAAITIGPDGKLYTATLDGYIYRFDINSNGSLGNKTTFSQVRDNNGGARFITGLTFDPRSTADNMVLWVSHGQAKFGDTAGYGPSNLNYADNFTGKISRLYKSNFSKYEDVIINIPRSVKDHLNNQIVFDPAQKNLYFLIPSMSAMGKADATWGNEPETGLTAALFRMQLRSKGSVTGIEEWLAVNGPINAQSYNPYKGSNPLRFFATGVRNAYDMLFHSNGRFYMPANGSAAGGNVPGTPNNLANVPSNKRLDFATRGNYVGPTVDEINGVEQTLDDYLFEMQEGGYYGHPNPARGEYVLNGGNPTSSNNDPGDVRSYPVGTQPDRNYRAPAFSFGGHQSPNGVIEYKSNAFGGKLKGYMIVARYSSGQDLIAVKPKADGTIDTSATQIGITGFTGLTNPLDLVENPLNGNIYVTNLTNRFGAGSIVLLRPKPIDAQATVSTTRLSLYATAGSSTGATKRVVLTNNGTTNLQVDVSAIKITGVNRKSFVVTNFPTADFDLGPGESRPFDVKFVAAAGDLTRKFGNLAIATNDPDTLYTVVQLRGFPVAPAGLQAASVESRGVAASFSSQPINLASGSAISLLDGNDEDDVLV